MSASAKQNDTPRTALESLLEQVIHGDFCADNPKDLKLAISAREELTAARAEAEALRKDAERYRWLRGNVYAGINRHNECLWSIRGLYEKDGQSFDAAIDAARSTEERHG